MRALLVVAACVATFVMLAGCSGPTQQTKELQNQLNNITTNLKVPSPTASPTPVPVTPTPTPTPSAPVFHNWGYHVLIYSQCIEASMSMADYTHATLQQYYQGNPRVTTAIYMKPCLPGVRNATCTGSDCFTSVTIQETGQVAYFENGYAQNIEQFVNMALNAGYRA
jgi:hypothetical protein